MSAHTLWGEVSSSSYFTTSQCPMLFSLKARAHDNFKESGLTHTASRIIAVNGQRYDSCTEEHKHRPIRTQQQTTLQETHSTNRLNINTKPNTQAN